MITISSWVAITYFVLFLIMAWLFWSDERELARMGTIEQPEGNGIMIFIREKNETTDGLIKEVIRVLNEKDLTRVKWKRHTRRGMKIKTVTGLSILIFDMSRSINKALPPISPATIFIDDSLNAVQTMRVVNGLVTNPKVLFLQNRV